MYARVNYLVNGQRNEEQNRILLFDLLKSDRARSQMADLHHAGTPGRNTDIDAVGWVFLVVASFLIIVAALIAYEAHEVANAPVSQTVAR